MTKVNLSISKLKGVFLSAFIFALIPFSAMFIDIIVAGSAVFGAEDVVARTKEFKELLK